MENFNSIVCHSGRGVFVRRIWLRIELPTYGCDKCYTEESPGEHKAHEVKFTVALSSLLGHLSSLRNDHPGIILELSVHSPSDSEHVCKEMRDTMRDTLWYASGVRRSTAQLYEQRHLWIAGSRKPLLPVQAHRLHGKAEGLGIDREVAGLMHIGPCELPLSRAVTELVIRLQFSRYFSVRRGLSTIIKSLPQLRSLRYECRSGWGHLVEPLYNRVYEIRKRDHIYLITHVLPRCKTLSAVNFFEVTEQHYSSSPWWRVFDPSAGHALRDNTSHLESLNFENFVDAIDFLDGTLPEIKLQSTSKRYEWPHLKRLRLTTNLIHTSSFPALLQSAALVAGRMPELRVMDFVGLGQNERFVYFVRDRQHVIVVPRGTAPRLNGATIRLWQDLSVIRGSPYDLKIQEIEEDGTIRGMPVDLQIGCSCTRTTEIQQGMSTEWKRW